MQYDLVIIGAGWAGFNAAIKAREYGLKTALIEKDLIGGTCLNRGCIPAKALIQSAKVYALAKRSKAFGIEISQNQVSFSEVQARKEKIVQQLRRGMGSLLKGVDIITGEAKISGKTIEAAEYKLAAKNILLACGSKPVELKDFSFDGEHVLSSDHILNLKEIPKSLLIVGAGAIGCEFASLFSILGSEVTLAEKLPRLLPGEDAEIARKIETIFKKRGIRVCTNIDASSFDLHAFERVLVCVGRAPREKIAVDEYLRTKNENIYAAGDCTAGIMLAHFAAYQGRLAAWNIAHPQNPRQCSDLHVPNCIFTHPEISSVGVSESVAKNKGIQVQVHKFDFLGSGMARIMEETEGFVKIISEDQTGKVLGASIIGPQAVELIGIIDLALTNGLGVDDIRKTIFAHPTLSEAIHDALE